MWNPFRRRRKHRPDLSVVGDVAGGAVKATDDFFVWMALADLLELLDR